ncbi:MAG: cytochrome c oxidase assembly protein, partial [Nocardioidaceae bacterium]
VTLMMTTGHPLSVTGMRPRAWGPAPLADLHAGGAVMWVGGAGLMLAFMVVALVQWLADPGRRDNTGAWLTAARRDALTEAARHAGTNTVGLAGDRDVDDDAALDAYNQTLAALARRSRDTETGDNAPKNGAQ